MVKGKNPSYRWDLKPSIAKKLLHLFADQGNRQETDGVHALTEYIIVLISNGRTRCQAKDQLEEFLGEKSGEFVSWLWDVLSDSANGSNTAGKKQKSGSSSCSLDEGEVSETNQLQPEVYKDTSDQFPDESKLETHKTLSSCEPSEKIHNDSLSGKPGRMRDSRGVLKCGEQSMQDEKFHKRCSHHFKRSHVANVAGGRLFSRATGAVFHQNSRLKGDVWTRLQKPSEERQSVGESGTTHSLQICQSGRIFSEDSDSKNKANCGDDGKAVKKIKRLLPESNDNSVSENGTSSGSGQLTSQKQCPPSGSDASASSISNIVTTENLIQKAFESPGTVSSSNAHLVAKPEPLNPAAGADAVTNLMPVQAHLMEVKSKLHLIETELFKLQSTQVEKRHISSRLGPVNHSKEGIASRTVFVTNVHMAATKEALCFHFANCGSVVRIIKLTNPVIEDQESAAYITFSSKESAQRALKMNGTFFFTQVIRVRKAGKLLSKPPWLYRGERRNFSATVTI